MYYQITCISANGDILQLPTSYYHYSDFNDIVRLHNQFCKIRGYTYVSSKELTYDAYRQLLMKQNEGILGSY